MPAERACRERSGRKHPRHHGHLDRETEKGGAGNHAVCEANCDPDVAARRHLTRIALAITLSGFVLGFINYLVKTCHTAMRFFVRLEEKLDYMSMRLDDCLALLNGLITKK